MSVLLSLVVPLVAGPAVAATWSASDPARDVTGIVVGDPATTCSALPVAAPGRRDADLRRVAADLGPDDLVVTLRVADVRAASRLSATVHVRVPGRFWMFYVSTHAGRTHVEVLDLGRTPPDAEACDLTLVSPLSTPSCDRSTATVSSRSDRLRLVVPRACLRAPRWVQVGAGVAVRHGRRVYADPWGQDRTSWTGRLSPRIQPSR